MDIQLYEIDPEGDIIIKLQASNPVSAPSNETQDRPSSTFRSPSEEALDCSRNGPGSEHPLVADEPTKLNFPTGNEPEAISGEQSDGEAVPTASVNIRVSSRHLILASPQAKRMLDAAWKERNILNSQGLLIMEEKDWGEEALLILMNIIHGKNRSVPKSINLEMLAEVAVLVDYYECYEAVEVYSDMWMAPLRKKVPKTYCKEIVLWVCISWIFRQPAEFHTATGVALNFSTDPIQTMELPIPERIIRESSPMVLKGMSDNEQEVSTSAELSPLSI
jgi:hypothetical protein